MVVSDSALKMLSHSKSNPQAIPLALASLLCLAGCHLVESKKVDCDVSRPSTFGASKSDIFCDPACQAEVPVVASERPISTQNPSVREHWDLQLADAIEYALLNSEVIRDLGGRAIRSPSSVMTKESPAIQETDPRFGVEAALSAFDASLSAGLFFENNDRALNNILLGGGTRSFVQDLGQYSSEISKQTATGTLLSARHNVEYDFNNAPGNADPNLPWSTNVELEIRHPLLQGRGTDFNRIAGPGATPGVYNGVLIARVNADISQLDFEAGIRDLVSDVETAYWELYYAFIAYNATEKARDRALETWRQIETWRQSGLRGGTPQREARSREQYYRFEVELKNLLAGQMKERSRATTFRGLGGIYTQERELRLLMGVPINDGRLIRPVTEPSSAHIVFDWTDILSEATTSRVEIRRQQMQIKRRNLELVAAKNFLLPRLDTVGRYRWRGLGHDLLDPSGGDSEFDNAYENMLDGNFQELQVGVELSAPVGFRQASAAVRHARLSLSREKAILEEQQRQVTLEISQALAELDRAYDISQIHLNRRIAAAEQLSATEVLYEQSEESQKGVLLDQLLDAQTRLADAETQYGRAMVEYMMAIKQIHGAKGSMLHYNHVVLAEGDWPSKARTDASERASRRIDLPNLLSKNR
ncbi:MAG: TolC family protein [Planctomycetota bacterium]